MKIQNRRFFLHSLAIGSIGIPFGFDLLAKDKNDPARFQIGVQEYTFNRMLRSGKLKHLDYPVLVKKELGIEHVEYWSRPFDGKHTDKKFVGKDLVYANVWKRGDKRTIYHVMYRDGSAGPAMMKRFYVNSITRDTEYDLTKGNKNSKILYFSANPNGEREIVSVSLRPRPHLKRLKFDVDLGDLLIKGRKSVGNRVTKELIQKVVLKETGGSTLAARKIWFDAVVGRLNDEERGQFLGEFKGEDKLLSLYANGSYKLGGFDLSTRFDDDMIHLEKWNPGHAISAVYYDGQKELHFVKRFECEINNKKRVVFISESEGSTLDVVSTAFKPEVKIVYNKHLKATKNLPDNFWY